MLISKKGQTAIEILVLVGIDIIGAILFGLFYIKSHPAQISEMDSLADVGMAQSVISYSDVTVPSKIVCGNFICESGEDCATCPSDCSCGSNQSNCGNGLIDDGEQCDTSNLNGKTCSDLGLGFNAGYLSCKSDCTFNTSHCYTIPVCGNGVVEGDEECDGEDLNNQSCQSLGYDFGKLSCTRDCKFDESGCGYHPDSNCFTFNSVEGSWRKYDTTDPNWFTRGNMKTWPDDKALWLCPNSQCRYIDDYYFLYNSFRLNKPAEVTVSALGDDETKVWLWPNKEILQEIEIIPRHVWINGWISNSVQLDAGEYSVVQLIYDTNRASTGAILSVANSETGDVILHTDLISGWRYYSTGVRLEEERFSSDNACSIVYSNQICGNEKIEGSEQCEGEDLGEYAEKTCNDINSSWYTGKLSCHPKYCRIDTSACKKRIELSINPESGSTRRNKNINITLLVDGEASGAFELVASINLWNASTRKYEPTDYCKLVSTGNYDSKFDLGRYEIPISLSYSFSCKNKGDYMFTFTGTLKDETSEASSLWKIS